uniref:PIH1D1/2/3 CS-like domain-containing protein n=1 Tax=Globisporangium ultimum (strain ATCC 200006 / CBS 805.95 / DAOM BR144) TaxID=431595 RepID=K3WAM9_GLOUD
MDGATDILALSELISGQQEMYDEDAYEEQRQVAKLTPSTVGGAANVPKVTRPIGQIRPADPRAIWSLDEVPSDDEGDDAYETRPRPIFDILYKQNVMTEDMFLGLSDKDPSSAHCEAMVVRVKCPNHRQDDIELDVKRQKLLLQSSSLKLSLYLPHPVRHQDGHAKWDPKKQTLTISLPIIRDEW